MNERIRLAPDSTLRARDMKTKRWIIGVVGTSFVVLHLLTWAFGVPAIHNQAVSAVVVAWEQKHEGKIVDIKPIKPRCQFGPAFAVFPCLIASRLACQTSSTGAESGWSLYLWYGFGVKRLWFRGAMA